MSVEPPAKAVDEEIVRSWWSPQVKLYVCIAAAHALVDCYGNVWAIFKKLAGLDLARAGLIATVATAVTAICQPLFGTLADRGHRRRLVLIGVSLACLNVLHGPVSRHPQFMHGEMGYLLMFLILVTAQMGLSMFHPASMTLASDTSADRPATLLALFIACGMIGLAASHLLFSTIYEVFNQHTEILLIPGLAVVCAVATWCHPTPTEIREQKNPGNLLKTIASLPRRLIPLWLMQVMLFSSTTSLVFLMPEFIEERVGIDGLFGDLWVKGGAIALFIAGSALIMVPAAHLADRFGRRRMLTGSLPCATAVFYLLVLGPDLPLVIFLGLIFITGGLIGLVNPMIVSMGQQLSPGNRSLATGLLMGLAWAAASPANALAGQLAKQEAIGPSRALAWLGLALVVATVLSFFLRVGPDSALIEGP